MTIADPIIDRIHELQADFHALFRKKLDLEDEAGASAKAYRDRLKAQEGALRRLHEQLEESTWNTVKDYEAGTITRTNYLTGAIETREMTFEERQGELNLDEQEPDTDSEPEDATSMGDLVVSKLNGKTLSAADLEKEVDLPRHTLGLLLRGLVNDGRVERIGKGRDTRYQAAQVEG